MTRLRARDVVVAFAAYATAVAWLTWPLAGHVRTHLARTTFICDVDLRQMTWALSWQSHTLTTAPWRLFEANIYHPTPHALLYADAGVGALPYYAPTYLVTGNPVLAVNLMFLGCIAATAAALHLLVARWSGLASAGVVAAGTFLATRWVLWTWVPAAPNYAVLVALPAIAFLAADQRPSRRRAALLCALVVLHGTTNPYYAASVLAPLGTLAIARLARPSSRGAGARLAVAVVCATIVLSAVYAPYAWVRATEPDLRYQTWWGFARSVMLNLPWGLLMHPNRPTAVPLPMLGLVTLGLVLRCRTRRDRRATERTAWAQGALWAVTGTLLSLTPEVRIGATVVRLPHAELIDRLPGLDLFRDPHRMAVAALFGVALLAGAAFAECMRTLERWVHPTDPRPLRGLAGLSIVLLAAGIVSTPPAFRVTPWPPEFPVVPAPLPTGAVLAALRATNGPLLEVPAAPDAPFDAQLAAQAGAQFDSIAHWRPLVNGYGGFFPAAFVDRMRLAALLPDATALSALRRDTGIEVVRVRTDLPGLRGRYAWEALAARGGGDGLRLLARDGSDLLFAVVGDGAVSARAAPGGSAGP